jgi:hypothetical protein
VISGADLNEIYMSTERANESSVDLPIDRAVRNTMKVDRSKSSPDNVFFRKNDSGDSDDSFYETDPRKFIPAWVEQVNKWPTSGVIIEEPEE